jgi:hypothetical protein
MNLLFSFRRLASAVAVLTMLSLGLRASAATPVPFRGRADLVRTSVEEIRPSSLRLTATATGQATHLGQFTRSETVLINLPGGAFTGRLVFVAANGDLLRATIAGQLTSLTGDSAEGTYVFRGGTGRFENASGKATFEVTPDGPDFDVTFNGTIQY